MYYTASYAAIAVLVDELKRFFATSPMRKNNTPDDTNDFDYTWSERETKIWISEKFPEVKRFYPSIIIRSVLNQPTELGLNQKVSDEQQDGVSKTYSVGGAINIAMVIDVKALSSVDRARVCDILIMGLLHPVRLALAKRGINLVPPFATMQSESERPLGTALDRMEYGVSIAIKILTYWTYDYDLSYLPDISDIRPNGEMESTNL